MSLIALLLFILACGWNVYRDYFPTRIVAIRVQGHPQHFGAVLTTGFVVLLAICIHAAASRYSAYSEYLRTASDLVPHVLLKDAGTTEEQLRTFRAMVAVAFWSGMLSLMLPPLMNLPFRLNSRLNLDVAWPRLDEVEQLLVEVSQEKIDLAVTLSTGKVYIGTPLDVDTGPKEKTAWVRLRPVASGYRNERGELVPTTVYEDIYGPLRGSLDGPDVNHFSVLLPLSSVVSLQRFHFELFTRNLLARLEAEAVSDAIGEGDYVPEPPAESFAMETGKSVAADNDENWADPWERWASRLFLFSLAATAVAAALSPWTMILTLMMLVFALLRLSEPVQDWWRLDR